MFHFDNSYARLPSAFYTALPPTPVAAPQLVAFNQALAEELRIDVDALHDRAALFSGNVVPEGAHPLAQLYAGHQFGTYNPQLGDGRAILLGEVLDQKGQRRDIQLKGAGPTPYSRMGDGRAWLGPVLREYVVSEAMHALGIPTTRALAATLTGEPVYRETGALPGAVLTRIAASHLRVGTFEIFAHRGQVDHLRTLTGYAMARHYPNVDRPLDLLAAVAKAQAQLIARWMAVGFIHGVMNTDNCAISGETIDYGPCAFMDAYHEARVFSSIDQMGRYAYGNQPRIVVWNIAQFATALIQQFDDKEAAAAEATAIVHAMPGQIQEAWTAAFGRKIGLRIARQEDEPLIEDLLSIMQDEGLDFTNTFRGLASDAPQDHFIDQDRFEAWNLRWQHRLDQEANPVAVMNRANPAVIPRNHRIEEMISAALAGDYELFERLNTVLKTPFATPVDHLDLTLPPSDDEVVRATFCGT